jgi:DNA-binding CsgD family transcriptional regulator/catechol 2,3-dioxygenase-like lactoylglutathione lyase family enzyme
MLQRNPKAKRTRRGRPPHDDLLTPAEWRVVHAVQHGLTSRAIAVRHGTSVQAVKFHITNVLAKLELSDRRALRRWFRVPKSSGLNTPENAMNSSMDATPVTAPHGNRPAAPLTGPIGQIARSVKDIGASERWYRDVLGLPHLYTFGPLAFFDCGGTRLLLSEGPAPTHESLLYWRVADIEAAHAELKHRGVEFSAAPHLIHRHADGTEEWMAFFKDPEGRALGIMAQVRPA